MTKRACVLGVLWVAACGGDVDTEVETTVATLQPIRGDAEGAFTRVLEGETVELSGLARLILDTGPRLLAEDATLEVEAAAVSVRGGRVYAEVHAGDALTLALGDDVLDLRDSAVSVADGTVYVVRGEVAHRSGDTRQVVTAGETLTLATDALAATTLWEDWTGGLAQPGPGLSRDAAIGALEGRVPDEIGAARWPLVIRRLDVRTRVVEDLAITEVEQVFFNPASETVEGIYRIRVPEGAVLQRFAVDRDGRLVDGYVKERAQARQQYEAQVYRGSTLDPALLEWVAPGEYKARIYPIAPGAVRTIAVRYAEWLERPSAEGPRVYRFPMASGPNAPHVQELSFEADLTEAKAASVRAGHDTVIEDDFVRLRQSDVQPRADLVIELEDAEGRPDDQRLWRATHQAPPRDPNAGAMPDEDERDYVYVPLHLPASVYSDPGPLDVVLVADVSAGTERSHLELGRTVVESLAAHLEADDRVAILGSDVTLRELAGDGALGPASRDRVDGLLDALAREPAGGATDLGASLTAASELLDPERAGIVIYIGDGAPTVGELEAESLLEHLERLPRPLRPYAIGVGDDANLGLLQAVTGGAGLALRVETRAAAADAALDVLAHARRPVAQRVTVELEGVEQLYPRRPADVVRGEPLPVVARVAEDLGSEIVVRGEVRGEPFEETVTLSATTVEDEGDLRLRWAGARLRQLLLGGAGREEVADLGVRYGLITPFTSFYVPSAAELAQLGPDAALLYRDTSMFAARPTPYASSWAPLAALLSTSGCNESESADVASSGAMATEVSEEESYEIPEEPQMARENTPDEIAQAQPAPRRRPNRYAIDGPDDDAAEYEPAAEQPPSPVTTDPAEPMPEAAAPSGRASTRARTEASNSGLLGALDRGGDAFAAVDSEDADESGAYGRAELDDLLAGALGGSGGARGTEEVAPVNEEQILRALERSRRSGGETALGNDPTSALAALLGDETVVTGALSRRDANVDVRIRVQAHRARRCSDAADLLLDSRRELWRERLGRQSSASGWMQVYREASRDCELPTWRDRRALLDLIIGKAGSVQRMVQVYRLARGTSARRYLRRAILRRVRTPADLRVARQAFGADAATDDLVAQVLERAGDGAGRVRALRRLIEQFPYDLELKLDLLRTLERLDRGEEARRYARELRTDPMTDAGVRTALGEMMLRAGDEAEARRIFSEIVEFAPNDALARRRLGDLYRAYGWFEDAYRQYRTLARITPDDPSVSLLLAQAAAGAGRVDEALRLEQRIAETAQPGAAEGLARVALLWSSVRFAELRQEASGEELDALLARMRRSGVLRIASGVRVTLVWSHPDAGVSLWAGHPGLGLTRPTDIYPEYGLEAFEVAEQESGAYRFEVRRAGESLAPVEAKLVVLIGEGTEEEHLEVVPLRFEGEARTRSFTLTGANLEASR